MGDGLRARNQCALHLKQLGKLQRKLSKKQKTEDAETKRTVVSSNYEQQRPEVAREKQQIANIRRDVQHKDAAERFTDLWDH